MKESQHVQVDKTSEYEGKKKKAGRRKQTEEAENFCLLEETWDMIDCQECKKFFHAQSILYICEECGQNERKETKYLKDALEEERGQTREVEKSLNEKINSLQNQIKVSDKEKAADKVLQNRNEINPLKYEIKKLKQEKKDQDGTIKNLNKELVKKDKLINSMMENKEKRLREIKKMDEKLNEVELENNNLTERLKIAEREESKSKNEKNELMDKLEKDAESKGERASQIFKEEEEKGSDGQVTKEKEKDKEIRTLKRNSKRWENEVAELKMKLNVMVNDKLLMVRTIRQLTGALEVMKRTQYEICTDKKDGQSDEKSSLNRDMEDVDFIQPVVDVLSGTVESTRDKEVEILGEYHCIEDDDVALEYTKEEVDECGMSSNMDEVAGLEIERSESKENQSGRIQNMENGEITNQATCSENNMEDKKEEK